MKPTVENWQIRKNIKMYHFLAVIFLLSSDLHVASFRLSFLSSKYEWNRGLSAIFANNQNGNMGFKRPPGNLGIPQDNKKDATDSLRTEARRRKVGPPNRAGKLVSREENLAAGRVSVYCIGAGLDLQALRAHVFRRGFGNHNTNVGSTIEVQSITFMIEIMMIAFRIS